MPFFLPLLALMAAGAGTGAAIGQARRAGKPRNPLDELDDAEEIDEGPDGAFMSALQTIGRPAKIVNNALVGNFEGAGRQLLDLGGDVIDAFLPGDVIPSFSRRKDQTEFSDVVGGIENPIGKFATDVVGGIATDPTNLIPLAAINKVGTAARSVAKKGVGLLPEAAQTGLRNAGLATKETLGWLNPNQGAKDAIAKANALRSRAAKSGQVEASRIMAPLPAPSQDVIGDVIDNLKWEDGRSTVLSPDIGRRPGAIESLDQQVATLRARLDKHPAYAAMDDASRQQIGQALEDSIRLAHTQYLDDLAKGGLARPQQYVDPSGKTFMKDELEEMFRQEQRLAPEGLIEGAQFDDYVRGRGLNLQDVDVTNASPRNYLQRLFEHPDDEADALMRGKGSLADAQKARTYRTDEELAAGVNKALEAGGNYERNAYKRLLTRSQGQGRMLQKATIASHILGDRFTNLVDGVHQVDEFGRRTTQSTNAAVDEALNAMAKTDPESARALSNNYHGMKARGPVLDLLAKANHLFKPAAVFGVVVPKMGSIVRNDLGTSWQILSEQGVGAAGKNLARMPRRLWDSVNDGMVQAFGLKRIKPAQLTQDIDTIENAYKAARGSADGVMSVLRQAGRDDLADAVEHGVLDGFVSTEEIMSKTAQDKWWKKKFFDLYDAPAAVFQGVEQRARLGNFLDQRLGGVPSPAAAQKVRESLLDYSQTSGKNRTLRDIIPFAAFLTGSTRQQAKFLARNPGVAGGISRALEPEQDSAVYPYMEGKLNIPIGADTEGNQEYLSGLGLPFEALTQIPNPSASPRQFGRDIERSLVGSSQPLLKTAYSLVSGEDPYFNSPYGSYSKAPVIGEAGDAGRFYNQLAGTGLIQPLDTTARLFDDALDPRHSLPTRALDLLTGANVVSVDPDLALQQQLRGQLEANPDIEQYRGFYDKSKDPKTQALLKKFQSAKKKVKDKRKTAEAR